MPRTIETEPVYTERVTPGRFSKVYKDEAGEFESIRIIAPRVGKLRDFGSIEVTRTHPIFKVKLRKSNKVKTSIYRLASGRFRAKK